MEMSEFPKCQVGYSDADATKVQAEALFIRSHIQAQKYRYVPPRGQVKASWRVEMSGRSDIILVFSEILSQVW